MKGEIKLGDKVKIIPGANKEEFSLEKVVSSKGKETEELIIKS